MNLIALLFKAVDIHAGIDKPFLDKANHLPIAGDTAKPIEGILEIDILRVQIKGLILRETGVVLP